MSRRSRQKGVALVESALTVSLFLLMIFAVIEFALLMFTWSKGAEAARLISRAAIVSDPIVSLTGGSGLDCEGGGGNTTIEASCTGKAECDEFEAIIQAFLPGSSKSNIQVTYSCSGVGYDDRPVEMLIPEVKVKILNYQYEMIVPSLTGLPVSWTLPPMTSGRTGEDLETIPSS